MTKTKGRGQRKVLKAFRGREHALQVNGPSVTWARAGEGAGPGAPFPGVWSEWLKPHLQQVPSGSCHVSKAAAGTPYLAGATRWCG